jgi:hypothetical protein
VKRLSGNNQMLIVIDGMSKTTSSINSNTANQFEKKNDFVGE